MHTITPTIHPHLLSELPRFFGGLPSAMQELLQNSLRAGATEVHAALSGDTFVLRDNGCGVSDPQILLSVAGSQWGEGVIDPAGLGGKAILNPEWVRAVTYRSLDWQFSVTPTQFQQMQAVDVLPRDSVLGLEVQIDLLPGWAERVAEAWKKARGYAPITVTLDGTVLPPITPHRTGFGRVFELTGATLYLDPGKYSDMRTFSIVWEHFQVAAPGFKADLYAHGSYLARAQLTSSGHLTLMLHPESEVRPRLPDRTDLLPSPASLLLIEEINAVLENELKRRFHTAVPKIDQQFPLPEDNVWTTANILGMQGILQAYLRGLGYQTTTLDLPGTAGLKVNRDDQYCVEITLNYSLPQGNEVHGTTPELLVLNHLRPAFPDMPVGVLTLNRQPQEGELMATVSIRSSGAREFWPLDAYSRSPRKLVALCEELFVQDQAVPIAVGQLQDGPLLLLAGTPELAEAYVRAHLASVGGLLLAAVYEEGETESFDLTEEHNDVSPLEAGKVVLEALIDTFFPERKVARERADELLRQKKLLSDLQQNLKKLSLAFPDTDWLSLSLLEGIPGLETRRAAEHQELVAAHRLH
ncbi:hypothetical protein [Deinococcus ruber]|uniref:Uncharacterized protein n=1 Tax=Deinococcus ruber TaxID=1848197 RepID=A0A918FHG3_9DEIO|nr:hypothetical protein [Deinococcus ruber]GGR37864.1 hypothetical protein GCM10008957_53940 [Deinococcus ruber]